MAMDSTQLANTMIAKLQALGFAPGSENTAGRQFFDALAAAIVEHIQTHARALVGGEDHPIE